MSENKLRTLRPKRSLKTLLLIWFLLLSLVPLMFVTGYSLIKYEQAIEGELIQRLRANSREFGTTVQDFEKFLIARRSRLRSDSVLASYLLAGSTSETRERIESQVRASQVPVTLNAFNSEGELVASFTKDDSGAKENKDLEGAGLYLNAATLEKIQKNGQALSLESAPSNSLNLIARTRLEGKNGRSAGFIEEIINIGVPFLEKMKKRQNLELVLLDGKGQLIAASHPDILLYPKSYFAKTVTESSESFFDLPIRDEPYGFITNTIAWGDDAKFIIAMGASKARSRAFVRNVNYAFFTMIGAIALLLVIVSIFATRAIVQPVYELVDAIQTMDSRDEPTEIRISSNTELGVLQGSFNEMSRRIFQAKDELENKVTEVEDAYTELKATQARLVHTAKMASLGQLVAGIAHELNNPIGFIYSNMTHLREHSEALISVIEAYGESAAKGKKAREEVDFDYIVEDLPRLITSCEDGARRTRDIVLGLRNFSRLDEAKLKKVSLRDGIENTLKLIAGELKNRVKVHTDYKPVPDVQCYASQLNQVFMNILTNAAQAIDGDGEIWITLQSLKGDGLPPRAQISIRDSGKGMPNDVIEKIFDPFFTTKAMGQGTGLGLSISYGIVKQHGGDIQVRSEPGSGTEFIITIPIEAVG